MGAGGIYVKAPPRKGNRPQKPIDKPHKTWYTL